MHTCEPNHSCMVSARFVDLTSLAHTRSKHVTNHSTAWKHPFAFVPKTGKFWFVTSCLLTVCIMVCKPCPHLQNLVVNGLGLVRKCIPVFKLLFRYGFASGMKFLSDLDFSRVRDRFWAIKIEMVKIGAISNRPSKNP